MAWDKSRWAFSAGVALLLLIATAAGILIVQVQASNRRVMHAFGIQVALEDLESTLAAAGRARMLYLSTNSPADLAEADSRIAEASARIGQILDQTQDIRVHRDTYTQLAALSNQRIAIIRASINDVQSGRSNDAVQAKYTGQIVDVSENIKDALEDMETHEQEFANQGRIASQRLFIAIVSILGCAFILSVGLLYLHYRLLRIELGERRRAEEAAIEIQKTLRLLSVRLIRAQDEQSRKFSRELHDSLGQDLSLAKMNLSRHLRIAGPSELVTDSLGVLDRCIAETRTISYLLHPPLLDDMGLQFAAKWYLEGFSDRSGIQVVSDIPDETARLPLPVEVTLFRVLQECLANIHRHSGSPSIEVTLLFLAKNATLSIRDFGKGIPADVLREFAATGGRVGVGLAGMRERVREQGGSLDIESDAGGTMVIVQIPATVGRLETTTAHSVSSSPER